MLITNTISPIFNAQSISSHHTNLDLYGTYQLKFSALHAVHKDFSLLDSNAQPFLGHCYMGLAKHRLVGLILKHYPQAHIISHAFISPAEPTTYSVGLGYLSR